MASTAIDGVLKYTGLILCTLIAALLCVASILFLAKEITGAGQRIHTEGSIRLVDFSFKTGRNFDELANALIAYRDCRVYPGKVPENLTNQNYIEKFDVVWSAFKNAYRNIYRHWTDTGYWLDESRAINAAKIRDEGLAFLDKYESDMSPDDSITCSRINAMLKDIYLQKAHISEFVQSFYELDNKADREHQRSIVSLFATIVVLGVSFLVMALIAIALVYKSLKLANSSLSNSKLAEQKAKSALTDLRESKDKNLAQKQFFAAANHDLRQPLHALGLYIGSLQRHVKTDEAVHILKCASLSAESLSALLDSLLDISKLDSGVIESNKHHFDVADLLSKLHARFLPAVEEKGLEFNLESDACRVFTDEQLLNRMLQNLISNAVAYTQSGHITIGCRQSGTDVVITVSDTGQGIPVDKQDAVFDEFYRDAGNVRDRDQGLGLGLSIVKRLGELLQVSLQLKSEEGVGTSISISLPSAGQSQPIVNEPRAMAKLPEVPVNLRVLVIDDEEDVRDSTAVVLESRGFDVRAVEDSEKAQLLCRSGEFIPQVIVSDYRLKHAKNGLDAILEIRQLVGLEVPAVLITGDTTISFTTRNKMASFEVLYKPVDSRRLYECIAAIASA